MTEDAPANESERIARWDAEVLNNLMSTPQGRYWVERHLDFCCEGRDLYLNDGDALGMAMRDGLARAGRKLRIELEEYCPDLLLRMVRERRARLGRAVAELAKREAAEREPAVSEHGTPIEAMADEQARVAAEEAERAARKAKPKKKD
jgi:hypothetical protein